MMSLHKPPQISLLDTVAKHWLMADIQCPKCKLMVKPVHSILNSTLFNMIADNVQFLCWNCGIPIVIKIPAPNAKLTISN